MESEQHHYELRSGSRSRSQTPSVQNRAQAESESAECQYDLRNRSRERSHSPEEMNSGKRSSSRSLPATAKTRDHSMETIVEKKEEAVVESMFENQSKTERTIPVNMRKTERRSERQKAKRQVFANGQTEAKEDTSGQKRGQKHKNVSPHRVLTSDYSSEEGERDDLPSRPNSAYEIYKQAGEWWNIFPKTDYTYSTKSQCRYEIAPGVLAMPNMSRLSVHSDGHSTVGSIVGNSVQNISQSSQETAESGLGDTAYSSDNGESKEISAQNRTAPHESLSKSRTRNSETGMRLEYSKSMHAEQYLSHREIIYTVPESSPTLRQRLLSTITTAPNRFDYRKRNLTTETDSDVELDEAVSMTKLDKRWRITQWFVSLTTIVTLWFNKLLEFLKLQTVRRRGYRATYEYPRYNESKWWYKAWRYIGHSPQYLYLFLVQILCFDTWLLSRFSSIRRRIQERRVLRVLWIALLPLILLTGYCLLTVPLTSFFSTSLKTEGTNEKFSVYKPANWVEQSIEEEQVVETLRGTIDPLDDRNIEQVKRRANITQAVEPLKENDLHDWSKSNHKVLVLMKSLEERKWSDANAHEIEAMKLELKSIKEHYSQLKTCCDTHCEAVTNRDLEERVGKILAGYFGDGVSKADFAALIRNLLVTADQSDSKTFANNEGVTEEHVRKIVNEALKIYDADKTGRVDYALESAGGQIISTRCTQRYDISTRTYKLLGFTLYHENNNPRTVIQGNPIQPGVCWAFQGLPGYLLIQLRSKVYVTGFTVEHAPKSILPNGEMKSAPRKFNVWGFSGENDPEPVMLGDYEFAASDESLQYFPVQNTAAGPYEYIELRVNSNHGQLEYTCLYRFRVHGRPI